MLRLVAVSLRRGKRIALDAVTVAARAGELLVIEGGRGAGKTSLLEVASARRRPDAGEVWIAGHDVAPLQAQSLPFVRRNIGYLACEPWLLPRATVLDNVMLPLGARAEALELARAAASRALERVGMGAAAGAWPGELSGAGRRLVAVARAIAAAPPLLLLDDPSASLAPADIGLLLSVLLEVAERGAAVVCASADASFVAAAVRSGARRAAMDAGRIWSGPSAMALVAPGRRRDEAAPEAVALPRTEALP